MNSNLEDYIIIYYMFAKLSKFLFLTLFQCLIIREMHPTLHLRYPKLDHPLQWHWKKEAFKIEMSCWEGYITHITTWHKIVLFFLLLVIIFTHFNVSSIHMLWVGLLVKVVSVRHRNLLHQQAVLLMVFDSRFL